MGPATTVNLDPVCLSPGATSLRMQVTNYQATSVAISQDGRSLGTFQLLDGSLIFTVSNITVTDQPIGGPCAVLHVLLSDGSSETKNIYPCN